MFRVIIPSERKLSDGIQNLLLKMLEKDPKKRYKIEDIIKDPWINEGLESLDKEV